MPRAITTKAALLTLAVFSLASAGFAQQAANPPQPPTYRVQGDPTTYALRPDRTHEIDLIPVPDAGSAKPAPEPVSYFQLEFVIKTLDNGKVTSSRTYTMNADTTAYYHASYRSDTSEGASSRTRNRTDIDCSGVHVVGKDSISLMVGASINSDLNPMTPNTPSEPASATYSGSFYTLAPLGKPTIVFSADAEAPNRKIQMEVTATPIHVN